MTNVVFLGMAHRPNDPRLCHREMRIINESRSIGNTYFISWESAPKIKKATMTKKNVQFGPVRFTHVLIHFPEIKEIANDPKKNKKEQLKRALFIIDQIKLLRPEVLQISDVSEIKLGLMIARAIKCRIVYDSHEDYYRQIIDSDERITFKMREKAIRYWFKEIRKVKHFDAVFCTDEFLLKKYRRFYYRSSQVSLLRNFPYDVGKQKSDETYEFKNQLQLVYIGGVNVYRGVIECAEFCNRFNKENKKERNLQFTVYGPTNEIIDDLKTRGLIRHFEWIDYSELMNTLSDYDVGVCLWQSVPKYHRNLPLKNFDYMAAGLPIITSNFNNIEKYITDSSAGICINPNSYSDFKKAILKLFNPMVRKRYGVNGQNWVQRKGNFRKESRKYVKIMLKK